MSVVVDLLLMGFRAHSPKIGTLGMLSILNSRSLRKTQKQEEPSDLSSSPSFPEMGHLESPCVKNAFLGPEGGRHSYQLRWNLGPVSSTQRTFCSLLTIPLHPHVCCGVWWVEPGPYSNRATKGGPLENRSFGRSTSSGKAAKS